jgi:hypothetical protein
MLRLYIAYHDDDSRQRAEVLRSLAYPFADLIQTEKGSVYFETSAIRRLSTAAHRQDWLGSKFVGIVPYSVGCKGPGAFDIQAIARSPQAEACDVIALLGVATLPLLRLACLFHGPWFCMAWHQLLCTCMGLPEDVVMDDTLDGFYCNAWLARPRMFEAYGAFLERCVHHMETDERLRMLLNDKSPTYASHTACRASTPYTMHPFLCERLPAFFFGRVAHARVLVASENHLSMQTSAASGRP